MGDSEFNLDHPNQLHYLGFESPWGIVRREILRDKIREFIVLNPHGG